MWSLSKKGHVWSCPGGEESVSWPGRDGSGREGQVRSGSCEAPGSEYTQELCPARKSQAGVQPPAAQSWVARPLSVIVLLLLCTKAAAGLGTQRRLRQVQPERSKHAATQASDWAWEVGEENTEAEAPSTNWKWPK